VLGPFSGNGVSALREGGLPLPLVEPAGVSQNSYCAVTNDLGDYREFHNCGHHGNGTSMGLVFETILMPLAL